ncbi:MAG: hypothetical protein HG423_001470 [Propionibacterium sp.]|nr:hypothetical protein [Propionibacterium sp.]
MTEGPASERPAWIRSFRNHPPTSPTSRQETLHRTNAVNPSFRSWFRVFFAWSGVLSFFFLPRRFPASPAPS